MEGAAEAPVGFTGRFLLQDTVEVRTLRRRVIWGELVQLEADRLVVAERDGTRHTILWGGPDEVDVLHGADALAYRQGEAPPHPRERHGLQRRKALAPRRKKGRTTDDLDRGGAVLDHRRGADLLRPAPGAEGPLQVMELVYSYDGPKELRPVPRPRPKVRSHAYRAFVREHTCISCDQRDESVAPYWIEIEPGTWFTDVPAYLRDIPPDAHHAGHNRGVGQKDDDLTCVPLCRGCHGHYHGTAGALPGRTREETALLLMEAQRALMAEFITRLLALHAPVRLVVDTPAEAALGAVLDFPDEAERSWLPFAVDAAGALMVVGRCGHA